MYTFICQPNIKSSVETSLSNHLLRLKIILRAFVRNQLEALMIEFQKKIPTTTLIAFDHNQTFYFGSKKN